MYNQGGHAGGYDAAEIRFDLVINIVCMPVEFGMAGIWWSDSLSQITPSEFVGMPELIFTIGEINARLSGVNRPAMVFQRLQEGHFHIEVVLLKLVDSFGRPLGKIRLRDNSSVILELRGATPADARHLSYPRGNHFVFVGFKRYGANVFRRSTQR